jgi:hypothetical protein
LTPGRPNDACCFPVARSQVFTPQPNAITNVAVNLPVKEDATPPPEDTTTIADFDTIGLAVLAPGVPVPLYYTGDPSQPADFVWNTSTPSTVTPEPPMSRCGARATSSASASCSSRTRPAAASGSPPTLASVGSPRVA